ncbi:ABC transporter substrate-binding protein [Devosia psychrophila]|uniref:ABC transporter substrate-binding protein n=1 Tax=Devosia psychrophila TaxID=728005 RepID=A0A0F5PTI5_9HYPH|nr:ABC transporter substrate-binding protein [Devosia psychrophila]KKC31099.1 ABC transporter substrate-binding protein [Devosia psychrophila]SFC64421.1 putative spermidine/putrescine transport system substrate-binding protein [Devosia psychrophila]
MNKILVTALAISATAMLSATPALAQGKTLTISWWGFNGEKLESIVLAPFRAQCGCEIVFETGNNGERLNKIQIRNGAGVDVAYFSDSFSQQGIEAGLFQKIDPTKIPNLAGIYDLAKDPQGGYGPAYTIGRVGIVYDTTKVTTPITSWNDLWREDLAGSLSLPGITTTAGPMVVMKAGDHASVDAFADEDAAFAAVAELKPNVVKNYNTGSEMINLFSTGEISAAIAQDFTLGQIQAAVPTVEWADLSEGAIVTLNTVNIPTGAAEPELAYEFINFILSPEIQQQLAEQGVDAPVVTSVELTPEQASLWTYGADLIAGLQRIDYAKMNAAKGGWVDRWNEIFGM